MKKTIIVTGGAGFIGSNLVHLLYKSDKYRIINVDALTYAGNLNSLKGLDDASKYVFEKCDVADKEALFALFDKYQPEGVFHLAAESHVDRSIDGPGQFMVTNIMGTYNMLEATRRHLATLPDAKKQQFRFLHISTDEVFGSLGKEGYFTETTPYDPRSPYSSSKASSDHLVRAWFHTFGLPVLITNCSNNYGPYQFPEKLIPVVILKCLSEEQIPVYGKGDNVRDWLYVEDHAHALITVFEKGTIGETYNVGGNTEKQNIEIVRTICTILDEMVKPKSVKKREELITFVKDRPGHDQRYAIDATKIKKELGWSPQTRFEEGIRSTVKWYLDNEKWWRDILSGDYKLERLGQID
ncbi:MAG TPA: dTDP-glucose 4,6-dehydratase [Tenuifilaceae bacterium]|nr:dTDP-glucose 4,6-dehydratase [Tenuifilaceae bacterium]HNV80448.1 dTDP-glucose 4,6-dehydratase [Tenuifilaceae bacterium]